MVNKRTTQKKKWNSTRNKWKEEKGNGKEWRFKYNSSTKEVKEKKLENERNKNE